MENKGINISDDDVIEVAKLSNINVTFAKEYRKSTKTKDRVR